jgi:hypothetical protein
MQQYKGLEKEILPFKKYVFKYWDKHGGGQFKTIMSLFSIRPAAKLVLAHWLIEWYGGSEKVKQLLKSLEKKNFVGLGGSYNFNFYLKNSRLYDTVKEDYPEVYFDAVVDGMGQVDITTDDDEVYDHISQAISDEEIGWEVDEEIRDVMRETIADFLPEGLDFVFDVVDVRDDYPSNLR